MSVESPSATFHKGIKSEDHDKSAPDVRAPSPAETTLKGPRIIMLLFLGVVSLSFGIIFPHPILDSWISNISNKLTISKSHLKSIPGNGIRSNGTHDFNNTVILISIDGYRWGCLIVPVANIISSGSDTVERTTSTGTSRHISQKWGRKG